MVFIMTVRHKTNKNNAIKEMVVTIWKRKDIVPQRVEKQILSSCE